MSLSFIGRQAGRVSWRNVLVLVARRKNPTSKDVSEALGISHPDACIRLKRLIEWGMVHSDGGTRNRTFYVTDYGLKVAASPVEEARGPQSLEDLFPNADGVEGVIDGPVALMRLVEVEYIRFEREGLDALQSRVKLSENGIVCEPKYDGWLCQSASGRLYSRRGLELTGKFPPLAQALSKFRDAHLVGELTYWGPDAKMSETDVTRVAGTDDPLEAADKMAELERKGIFQIVLYDLIGQSGKDVSKRPFGERRKMLESMVDSVDERRERLTLSPTTDFDTWREVFRSALAQGGEGVVLKNREAPYLWRALGDREAKPAGTMWKLKAVRSDDFVVFAYAYSDKDKLLARFGQFWKGRLVEVGNLDNFSADMEREVLKLLEKGPFVMEIGFQERYSKPPGKLRNARYLRLRPDKPIESATLPAEYAPKEED